MTVKQELTMSSPIELLKLSAAKRDAAARAIESELHEIVYEQKFVTVGDCIKVASIALKAADEVQSVSKGLEQ